MRIDRSYSFKLIRINAIFRVEIRLWLSHAFAVRTFFVFFRKFDGGCKREIIEKIKENRQNSRATSRLDIQSTARASGPRGDTVSSHPTTRTRTSSGRKRPLHNIIISESWMEISGPPPQSRSAGTLRYYDGHDAE